MDCFSRLEIAEYTATVDTYEESPQYHPNIFSSGPFSLGKNNSIFFVFVGPVSGLILLPLFCTALLYVR